MKTAIFFNWTDKPFTGYWNGKPQTIQPGKKLKMIAGVAETFAKHLTNQVLIEKKMENYTSPKKPEEVPEFMKLFEKAYIFNEDSPELDESQTEVELSNTINSELNPQKSPKEEEKKEEEFGGLNK